MRITQSKLTEVSEVTEIVCNKCGKNIEKDSFGYFEECLSVEKLWGYKSKRDGVTHSFDICQDCYDSFIAGFSIPVGEADKN